MCHSCSVSFLFPEAPLRTSHFSPASAGREGFCIPSCSSAPLRVTIIAPQFPSVLSFLSEEKSRSFPRTFSLLLSISVRWRNFCVKHRGNRSAFRGVRVLLWKLSPQLPSRGNFLEIVEAFPVIWPPVHFPS
ncbi:hypothetical protein TGVEG_264680 [Toxoplasma gondii VEG]|uniref:Uncharacterized protein n=2 Tax=Toxoplasma gondii TaxID=5811 RepID=V4ZN03_TOXGV|nr:hypothetical protein TGVEG_264680 [Toxoplasma gondii VEG]KFG32498.1 hypothetical protein TGP89_264680 [Toxoplasma gondii p89]CEL75803.1 TPA: hypothetical protein BN1205_081590 [Toxoplasma gondii VEG]